MSLMKDGALLWLYHEFWLSSCSRTRWRGERDWFFGFNGFSRNLKVDERLNAFSLMKGVGDVMKENVFVLLPEWSLDLRIG
jgi:hypothetical protein